MFRNNNPDKGTETFLFQSGYIPFKWFRNNNPDKGTETFSINRIPLAVISLEIITPIRGRKPSIDMPSLTARSLEIITPIRGRKHYTVMEFTFVFICV